VQLKMGEGPNDFISRGARRIFGPPSEHVGPHANDGLGQNIRVETISGAPIGDGLAASGAHAACQALEDSRADFARLSARMKHDSQQFPMVFGEADQGVCLALYDLDRIGHFLNNLVQARFEYGRSLFGQFAKERELVLEVEIERARRITSLLGDGVARDAVRAKLGEESQACIEESTTSRF
jgi:hypothetical protein